MKDAISSSRNVLSKNELSLPIQNVCSVQKEVSHLFMAALWNRAGHYIFAL